MVKFYDNFQDLSFIHIKDYADSSIKSSELHGLTFYAVKNCLAMGKREQTLLPAAPQTKGRLIFEESYRRNTTEANRWNIYHQGKTAVVETLDEAVPLYPIWGYNFWHWTFDCMPVIIALESAGYKGSYIVPNVNFIKEFLDLFELDKSRIFFAGPVYHIKKALIPQQFTPEDHFIEKPELLALFRCELLEKTGILPGERSIYVKRIHTRKIENEAEVLEVLGKYDFEVLVPEEHSVKDQFGAMTNCGISFMPHGANTTLALSQKEKSSLLECFRFSYVNPCNLHTVSLMKMLYIPIVQKIHSSALNKASGLNNGLDIRVNTNFLKIILENILSGKKH